MTDQVSWQFACKAGANNGRQIMRPEMLFYRREIFEHRWLWLVLGPIRHDLTSFFFPLLNCLRIASDLDRPSILFESHSAAETLLIKGPEKRLECVIIGWPEQLPTQCTARY